MAKNEIQKPETTDIEKKEQKPEKLLVLSEDSSDFACYLDTKKFNQLYRVANMFASSQLVPEHYRNKPADCFIALQMAMRMRCEPVAFMQGTYVVHGKPGMEAKLAIALINSRGPFEGPVQWKLEGSGDDRKCTAYAKHKLTGQVCQAVVSMDMAKKEGWVGKTGSKWKTMPDIMLQYRSATFLGRLHCPEVLYGMQTVEEIKDVDKTFVESQVIAEETIEEQAGSEAIDTKFEEPTPEPEQPKPQPEPQEPQNESSEEEKDSLKTFVCPECWRTYKMGEEEGRGVKCECNKSEIVLVRYVCKDGHRFHEPKVKNDGTKQCPRCLTLQMDEIK